MNLGFKIGSIAAVIYMLLEVILLLSGVNHDRNVILYTLGANSLILLIAVALSILINFNRNKAKGLSMIVDIKMGISAAAVYAILVSAFLFLYFSVLDPSYPEMRKQQMIELMQESEAQKTLEKDMAANPDAYGNKSADDVIEMNMDNAEHLLSAKTVFPIALFSLLMLGMIYAFFVTAFNRLILAKL